jgi:chromosome segregation ATPase
MLNKMQGAVEEIAQLYGNPTFLQVFTNDVAQASELKSRLKWAQRLHDIRLEVEDIEKTREDLLNDIALKRREAGKLSEKLLRQRKALDAIAAALEQARSAVEDTVK